MGVGDKIVHHLSQSVQMPGDGGQVPIQFQPGLYIVQPQLVTHNRHHIFDGVVDIHGLQAKIRSLPKCLQPVDEHRCPINLIADFIGHLNQMRFFDFCLLADHHF